MTTPHEPGAPIADGVDIAWKIRHLTASIRNRERMLTFGGFATPHTPEALAVIAARTAGQVAAIADKRRELAHWEALAAASTPAND
jgi:hypothetical protein